MVKGPAIQRERTARARYLRALRERLERLDISAIGGGPFANALREVFVDPPVPLWISIEVDQEHVTRWLLTHGPLTSEAVTGDLRAVLGLTLSSDQISILYASLRADLGLRVTTSGAVSWADLGHPLIAAPPWTDGLKLSLRRMTAIELLSGLPRAVVTGPPGAGKSTLLKFLAVALAARSLEDAKGELDRFGGWVERELTPVYCDLGDLVRWREFPKGASQITEMMFWKYLTETLTGFDADALDELHLELQNGRGLLLLDGLDEVPSPRGPEGLALRRRQMADLARMLETAYGPSPIIFSSRDYGYRDWSIEGFARVPLAPFAPSDVRALLTRLYYARELSVDEIGQRAVSFRDALRAVPPELQDWPLFLVLLASMFERDPHRSLPKQRGALYKECIDLLMNRWTRGRPMAPSLAEQLGCTTDDLYDRLVCLAHRTQLETDPTRPEQTAIDEDAVIRELFKLESGKAIDALAFLSQHVGILVSPRRDTYTFLHRGFQEYLAATWLAADAQQSGYDQVRTAIESEPQAWREPCLMLGDVLQRKGGPDSGWALLEALLAPADQVATLEDDDPRVWSVWLAARLVQQLPLSPPLSRYRQQCVDELRAWLSAIVSRPKGLQPIERCDLGLTLGTLGDPRIGVGLRAYLPDVAWCLIPGGEQDLGLSETQREKVSQAEWSRGWTFGRDTPRSRVVLPSFRIAKYPITIAQYQVFVDGGGYTTDEYWSAEGRVWRTAFAVAAVAKQQWGDQGNLPITDVSWHEACAFCSWLSEATDSVVRLPRSEEWERAARGCDGRVFPWGDAFDARLVNCGETGIARVAPVGLFPPINGPWGADTPWEMSGNVWEWCADEPPASDYIADSADGLAANSAEDRPSGERMRQTRGGCFLNLPFLLRTTFSGRDFPSARYSRQGFRIVQEVPAT